MEKSEMMKKFEAETGESLEEAKERWKTFAFYSRYIAWLEAQLTWRPVSEKPKHGQIVFVIIPTGWVVSQYLHGKFYIEDGFTFGDLITGVTHWLPIPPAPEVKV